MGGSGKVGSAKTVLKVGKYTYTDTAGSHVNDLIPKGKFKGELSRPYMNSAQVIDEIISTGKGVPDPGGLANTLKYEVKGSLQASKGVYELVVDPTTNQIYHFNFKSI